MHSVALIQVSPLLFESEVLGYNGGMLTTYFEVIQV